PKTLKPIDQPKKATQRLLDLAYERGLIIYGRRVKGGVDGDNFMVAPPMIVTSEQVGEIISIIGDSLEVLAGELDLPVEGRG
ncbi:aspartate aminotransferase family protein, partial [Mesorhizobium sp. M8A.F.Ca.ET.023.01.1.1]